MTTEQYTIVGTGIDTLKINIKLFDDEGELSKEQTLPGEQMCDLSHWQEQAVIQRDPIGTSHSFHGARLVMYPNGAPSWKYILRNDCLEIKVVPRLKMPMVAKVTLLSPYLWEVGDIEQAVTETRQFLQSIFGPRLFLQAAQIDLCVDMVCLTLQTDW